MDSFELNKIIGAVLGTVFVVFTIGIVSDSIFAEHAPEKPGFVIAALEEGAGGGETEEEGPEAIGPLLASADVAAGETVFKKCTACHTVDKGGANKVGPNLWDIVNRPVASHEGFGYSAGMREFSQGGSVAWDYEHLSNFLLSPRKAVPGTAMGFAGLKNIEERANVIAYLRTLADTPAPLPEEAAGDAAGGTSADSSAASGNAAAPTDSGGTPAAGSGTTGEGAAAGGDTAPAAGATEEVKPAGQD
jgi:cytochrome c